jgi:hypothetical protein
LINQVLDLAKVESGRQELNVAPMNLSDLITHAERMFTPLARDKGLAFRVKLTPGLPAAIPTDKQRVEQILNNLLGNAIKFTERGSVTLRIGPAAPGARLERKDLDPARALAISVIDTGIGIAAGDQQPATAARASGSPSAASSRRCLAASCSSRAGRARAAPSPAICRSSAHPPTAHPWSCRPALRSAPRRLRPRRPRDRFRLRPPVSRAASRSCSSSKTTRCSPRPSGT